MVISAAAKTGRLREAESWFEKAVEEGFEPQAASFGAVMSAAAVRGNLAKAEEWFERLQGTNLTAQPITYKTLMNAASKAGDLEAAERWFSALQQAQLRPDAISYNTLIDAAKRCRDKAAAMRWYDEMLNRGLEPDKFTFGSLIALAGVLDDPDSAAHWVAQAKGKDVRLSSSSYGALVKLHCRLRKLERLDSIFAEMTWDGVVPDIYMLNRMLEAYAEAGQGDRAEEVLRQLVAEGVAPTEATLVALDKFPDLRASAAKLELERSLVPDAVSRRAKRLDRDSDKWKNTRNQDEMRTSVK